MFNQPDSEFSTFSWLVFGLVGIVLSIIALSALEVKAQTTVNSVQAMSGAIIVLFVTVQLLRLVTCESRQE